MSQRSTPPAPNCPSAKRRSADHFVGSPFRDCSCSVAWIRCRDGKVPSEAVVAGMELNNPKTYIGRVLLHNEKCFGRVVPSSGSCFCLHKTMEHKRSVYEVLVNVSRRPLIWRREYKGHVPDTAIAAINSSRRGKETSYFGRAALSKEVVVPGYIVPSHGAIHVGYDNKESVKEEYEVLCEDQPCSLRYLASKKIRDLIRERERIVNSRYTTKIMNMLLAVEKVFASIIRKAPKRRKRSSLELLELPHSLVNYLRSPRQPNVTVLPRLDFNTIMSNCCPPEENCSCQLWIEITLQGLY